MKFVNSVASRDIFNGHAPRRTHKDNNFEHQNAVDIECDWESSKYDHDFDLSAVSIYYFNNHESRVFECLLHWCFIQSMWAVKAVRSQGRLTPGLWYRACQSPYFQRSVSPRRTRIPVMPSSAVCPEQMFRTVDIKVTCNNITATTKFNFWPGILQRIQTYACKQQNISMEPNQEQAVHITEELAVNLIV